VWGRAAIDRSGDPEVAMDTRASFWAPCVIENPDVPAGPGL
jgi:hypothetical protein